MLSSLGFDSKGSRNARSNSKYVLEVPRGFSVHVFKSPSPPIHATGGANKDDYAQGRTQSSLPWKPTSYPSRPENGRKTSGSWPTEGARPEQTADYDRDFGLARSKSNKPYGIVPSTTIPDTYIYEPSISSFSDLPGSPDSSSSSDTDSVDSVTPFNVETSSTRASSSVETLEATSYFTHNRDALISTGSSPYGAVPRNPVIPVGSRSATSAQTSSSPPRQRSLDTDDDDTVVSDGPGVSRSRGSSPSTGPNVTAGPIPPAPSRRNSDERSSRAPAPPPLSRRESSQRSRSTSPTAYAAEDDMSLRLPPGLQYAAPVQIGGPTVGSLRTNNSPTSSNGQRSPRDIAETSAVRGGPHTDCDGLIITSTKRCVRWTEELVCPSPILAGQRRKGWFNRRGDQLWTNDGRYRCVEVGMEYPPDLANYPEPGAGWMNEDGTRIDLQHRLIPRPPLRSALKRSSNSSSSIHDRSGSS